MLNTFKIETIPDSKNILLRATFFSLILALIIGFVIGILSPLYAIGFIVFLFFIILTISNIRHGILFWLSTGGLFAVPLYTIRNTSIYPSMLMLSVVFIFWIFIALETKKFLITQTKLFWPLILLVIITILSSFKGVILYDPEVRGEHRFALVQIFASFLIIFSVFTAFLIPRFFQTTKEIRQIYSALIYLGIGIFIFELSGLGRFGFSPIWAPLMQANAVSLSYTSLLFMPELSLWRKILFSLLIIFSLQYILAQFFSGGEQWITGWVVFVIPLIFITFCRSKKWGIFLVILFSVLIFTMAGSQVKNMFDMAEKERDYDRLIMWMFAFKIWIKNPFFGVGPGNYMDYILTYAHKEFAYTSAHNQYFQILTELGGIAFVCFSGLIIKISFLAKYLFNKITDNFLKVFIIAIIGSIYGQLCASFMGDYILPAYHNGGSRNISTTIYFWVLVGTLIAIEQIVKDVEGSTGRTSLEFKTREFL
ncbi:MAG: O-antigen ligase family protein [bacterium]